MTTPSFDVVAIGNAIVDVLAQADDAFIAEEGMTKGSMQLMFSPEEADALYAKMGPGIEVSRRIGGEHRRGRSPRWAASAAFIGQVADDQLGEVFAHDIRAAGVAFRHRGARRRADHRALPDLRHARWPADDEHLPRRVAVPARQRRSTAI